MTLIIPTQRGKVGASPHALVPSGNQLMITANSQTRHTELIKYASTEIKLRPCCFSVVRESPNEQETCILWSYSV